MTAHTGPLPVPPRTVAEMADWFEVDALLNLYVTGVDDNRFDLLDQVFTPDAHIDYGKSAVAGDFTTVKAWLVSRRPLFSVWLHVVGNRRIQFSGDTGTALSSFFFTGVSLDGRQFLTGGEYRDVTVRTADGWRISERVEVQLWATAIADPSTPEPVQG